MEEENLYEKIMSLEGPSINATSLTAPVSASEIAAD
jgi:hypothetical protein